MGAVITSSIFIDSSTTTGSPVLTAWPVLAATSITEPGIGARRSPSACAAWASSAARARTAHAPPPVATQVTSPSRA